jgi:signal transduction histidine kinase
LGALNLSAAQFNTLNELHRLCQLRIVQPVLLDPLTRSDREDELEIWLEERGVEGAWEFAPALVSLGIDGDELTRLVQNFMSEQIPTIVALLGNSYVANNLLAEIGQGTARITEVVKALKSYSYLDQAPMQRVDINKGLDDTLVMLRSDLKSGVTVRREFAEDLPHIQAFGSELNQVWTHLIENAIAAMAGHGELVLRTFFEGSWLVIQIRDTGPGIPAEVQPRIFDPFFTTKPPGEGAGLGLTISHRIIVEKHKGTIAAQSEPGETVLEVWLPSEVAEGSGSVN